MVVNKRACHNIYIPGHMHHLGLYKPNYKLILEDFSASVFRQKGSNLIGPVINASSCQRTYQIRSPPPFEGKLSHLQKCSIFSINLDHRYCLW
jgi:hypothetical protein